MVWKKFDRCEDQSGLLVIRDSRATNCLKTGFAKLVRNYALTASCKKPLRLIILFSFKLQCEGKR